MPKAKLRTVPEKKLVLSFFLYLERISKGEIDTIEIGESKNSLIKRICQISQLSKAAVYNVISDENLLTTRNDSQIKQRRRKAPKTDLDVESLQKIREIVYNFHITEQRLVTVKPLREKIDRELRLSLSSTSLLRVLHKIGFKFIKSKNNRLQLVEQDHIKAKRKVFIETIQKYRKEGRPVEYVDESYVHTNYTTAKAWQDESSIGFRGKIGKGQRFIIGRFVSIVFKESICSF